MKNCDAKCDAHQFLTPMRLWLRNRIFYSIMELPHVNGKRRYQRISLHTTNYYEAREKIYNMTITYDKRIAQKIKLKTATKSFWTQEELIKLRDEAIKEYNEEYAAAHPNTPLVDEVVSQKAIPIIPTTPKKIPQYTIQSIFEAMLLKGNNKKASRIRKKNTLIQMLKEVGLSMQDDYAKLHDHTIIDQISKNVLNINSLRNGGKKSRLAYIKELVSCACAMEPELYSTKVIANLPKIQKDSSKNIKSHRPYSDDQLLNIFNPKHLFFKENPDSFWICMVALFTGSRANAAITLQYDDIIKENGIDCICFQSNHKAKQLKNQASERIVPIHHQLLNLGFLDYINRKRQKQQAKGTDFIFDNAVTRTTQEYNNKYIIRTITPFLKEIGIKRSELDGYDFHSFRQTVSRKLQDANLPNSYINNIVGWEGKGTMESSYSNHTVDQIQIKLDSFEYDFLQPAFDQWKIIMAKKP